MKRLLVAVVLIPLLFLYVMKLPAVYYAALLIAVSMLAQSEFYSMYKFRGFLRRASVALGTLLIIAAYFDGALLPHMLAVSLICILGLRLFLKKDPVSALGDVSIAVTGVLYIPLLLSLQINLRGEGPEWIVLLYGSVWAADSAAYYIGTGIGGRKLYKEMSPNKTVAGAVGSVAGGITGAFILRAGLSLPMPLWVAAVAGGVIGIVSIIGDLVESMFKRDAGIKDSGGLLPGGHGGMLDKIDSALFVGPVLYWVLKALRGL